MVLYVYYFIIPIKGKHEVGNFTQSGPTFHHLSFVEGHVYMWWGKEAVRGEGSGYIPACLRTSLLLYQSLSLWYGLHSWVNYNNIERTRVQERTSYTTSLRNECKEQDKVRISITTFSFVKEDKPTSLNSLRQGPCRWMRRSGTKENTMVFFLHSTA